MPRIAAHAAHHRTIVVTVPLSARFDSGTELAFWIAMPNQVLHRFRIVGTVAVGGMGEVFLADDERTGGRAVLKLVRRDAEGNGVESRFEHEIALARRLHHPLLPQYLDEGSWGSRRVLALEYIDGVSLSRLLKHRGAALPALSSIWIAVDVLRALHAVHASVTDDGVGAEIVHGDVSPQNVIVGRDGRARLIDFGISTERSFREPCPPGQVVGKLGYLAPEQLLGKDVDARADQYSVGVLLVEMLTGRRLFAAANVDAASPTARGPLAPLSSLIPTATDALRVVLDRMLRPEPWRRYDTCRDALDALMASSLSLPTPTESPCDLVAAASTSPDDDAIESNDVPTVSDRRRFPAAASSARPVQ